MKKRIRFIIVAAVCLAAAFASFGVTYSFLIDEDTTTNVLTVGETITDVEESFTPPAVLEPGIEFSKAPHVNNVGNLSCYIRMRVDYSTSAAAEFSELRNMDTTNWVYNSADGYYYYKKAVPPGGKTTDLFKKVKILSSATMSDMENFDILIYSEAVQVGEYTTYQQAWGLT